MMKQAPKKLDVFATANEIANRLVAQAGQDAERLQVETLALQSVVIARAIDRLTEAVQANTRGLKSIDESIYNAALPSSHPNKRD